MANFNNIKHEIDQNVNTNGVQAITGAILNETLKDMIDEVDDKKQDTLVAGQNITIQGNVISATGGGSGSYVEGNGIEISGNVISVAPDEIAGSGLRSDGEGHLELDPNDLPPTYAEGFGIDITTGPDVIAVDTSVIQEKLTAGSNITLSGNTISATDTTYSAGSGILIDQNNEISADTSVLQPKLTAGSGISISAQNVISATGGGGGGTTYGDGDAISIDSNDNINVLYGNGLQLDGNGALEVDTAQVASDLAGNGLQVDANGALEVDPFGMPFLPLAGGQLQDDPNNTNSTDLNITSPSSYAHIDAYTEDDPNNPGGTAYVEVYDMNGTAQYGSDGITVNGDKLTFPAGPATLATQSDLSDYLPLTGGTLNNTGQINTNLSVQSPNSDYHVNTYVPNSGSVEIEIGMSSGQAVQNPSDGDTKNLRVYKDKVDLYTYDSGTSNWRTDSLYFPKKKTGTIALDSDLAGKQDTLVSGTNIKTINGNSLLGSGDITISGGQSYTAGNGIDITSGTISVDASDLAGTALTSDLNGHLNVDANALAGNGLQVDANGYLEVVGGGGGSLWTSGTGSESRISSPNIAGTASGDYAIAGGWNPTASGDYSFAFGNRPTANGANGVAIGYQPTAGTGSVALGYIAEASGQTSFAAGHLASATGLDSTAIGPGASATAGYSVAIGNDSSATGSGSVAIGTSTETTISNEQAFGKYNLSNNSASDDAATAFTIGNGTSVGARSNSFEIKKNNDVYLYGVGGYNGTNAAQAQTLQDVINNGGGGGGTSFTPGDALELDQNDNLNVLYGSGLTLNGNNELEVDPNSISGFLPLGGGTLQHDPNDDYTTELIIETPESNGTVIIDASDTDPNNAESQVHIDMTDSNGSVYIYTTGISDGTYTTSWPSPSADTTFATLEDVSGFLPLTGGTLQQTNGDPETFLSVMSDDSSHEACVYASDTNANVGLFNYPSNPQEGDIDNISFLSDGTISIVDYIEDPQNPGSLILDTKTLQLPAKNDTIATLSDIQGGGSYTAGNGIDITSGTISVDETYLDQVYLPILGGSLENTSNHTDLRVDAPNSESDNFVDILSPGTGVPSVELGTDTNTQGEVESLKFKGDADIDIKYVGDNTTYTLSLPTLTQNETIATLSDIQGGGTSYTAGTGISISAQNVISNSAPDPGLWVAGTGTDSIRSFNSTSATGSDSISIGYHASATANNAVAVGPNANAASESAVSVGGYVSAPYSIAGPGASITGGVSGYGVAFGYNAQVDNNYGVAIGYNAYSKVSGEYTIGDYNKYYSSNNTSEKVLFSVGNGSGIYNRANALEFKQNNDLYVYGVGSFDGTNAANASTLQTVLNGKQDALTAGTGISISGNVISATGGGGGGLWTSGTGTDSLVAPGTVSAGLTGDAAGTGAVSCGYDSNANGDYSFACGGASTAGGDYSFAANNGTAGGDYSAAFGTSGASGDRSFAAGDGSIAGAAYSVALAGGLANYDDSDPNNIIDAEGSVAIGKDAATNAYQAIAIGYGAVANGIDSIAIGTNAIADTQEAIAIGSSSNAQGQGTVALSGGQTSGDYSTGMSGGWSIGDNSVAGGMGAVAGACSSVALGFNTMTYDQGDPTDPYDPNAGEAAFGRYNYTDSDIIFSVGCGYEVEHDPNDADWIPNPDDPESQDPWTEIVRKNAITISNDGSIYINDLGGYAGAAIGGAESLQTVISNLNPL